MEPATLSQARRQLAARLALFTTGLLVVFLLETSSQLKESDRNLQQRQLQLLGQVATHHFRELNHSTPAPTAMAGITTKAVASGSTAAQIRILWLDRALTILDEYGSFRPGGALVPPAEQRHRTQWMRLSNGTGLWLPVSATADPGQPLGYIAVASSEAPYKREVLVSLVGATAASVLMALLGIAWILERSLQPLRAQINRLHEFAGDVAHELRNPLMALKASLANTRSLLGKDQPAPALTAVLGTLDRIGSRMTTILDDLLLLTRLDAGSDDPEQRCDHRGV